MDSDRRKKVLLVYGGRLLWPWAFLKETADVDYRATRTAPTPALLREFGPHVIAGLGFEKGSARHSITGELMDACEHLEFIQVFTIGYDTVDVAAASQRGIMVANLGGVGISSQSVAELAWAHILALARRIPQVDAEMRSGALMTSGRFGATDGEDLAFYRGGPVLSGKTLGIIGLGKIGKRSALIGRLGFNMKVIACDPYVPTTDAEMIGVHLVGLDTVLAESDVITIHASLTDETRGMIGEREIGRLKSSAIIVNAARGEIVDAPALARAVEEGRIYGAGIDTWPVEPPDPSAPWVRTLAMSRRTSLSCHIGSLHEAMIERHKPVWRISRDTAGASGRCGS
jgi:D-3-phosphoglycerate dehydrogenase